MIKYAILRGVISFDTYELVYVNDKYFEATGHLDDGYTSEYEAFESVVEPLGLSHSMDATLTVNTNDMEDVLIAKIKQVYPDAEYSEDVYNFMIDEAIDSICDDYTAEEICDFKADLNKVKQTDVAVWREECRQIFEDIKNETHNRND